MIAPPPLTSPDLRRYAEIELRNKTFEQKARARKMLTEQAEQEEQDELAIEEGTLFESTAPPWFG